MKKYTIVLCLVSMLCLCLFSACGKKKTEEQKANDEQGKIELPVDELDENDYVTDKEDSGGTSAGTPSGGNQTEDVKTGENKKVSDKTEDDKTQGDKTQDNKTQENKTEDSGTEDKDQEGESSENQRPPLTFPFL